MCAGKQQTLQTRLRNTGTGTVLNDDWLAIGMKVRGDKDGDAGCGNEAGLEGWVVELSGD